MISEQDIGVFIEGVKNYFLVNSGKPIEVVQGGADARPGFGREAMNFTTSHFQDLTGRTPTSVRTLFEQNKERLLTPPAPRP